MSTLVFPSALEDSARYADEARSTGTRIVGASSIERDPNVARFDSWVRLPFIGDAGFFDALARVVAEHGIRRLYTPHAPTFHLLERQLPVRLPNLELVGDGPFKSQMRKVHAGIQEAAACLPLIDGFAGRSTAFSPRLLAGLLAQVDRLHGECSRQKILALCAIVPDSPPGDLVEIGCLYGKSCYVLNRLGSHFGIGATLAIDAWNLELSVQTDAPANIQEASSGWDWDVVYQGFLINLLGSSAPPFNYLRSTSEEANRLYRRSRAVESCEFGSTLFAGRIAVLHIDGNHDEAAVEQDFRLWAPLLTSGGWIVFDDYHWPHGDGPHRVADRALQQYGTRVVRHFVGGGALFMKISH